MKQPTLLLIFLFFSSFFVACSSNGLITTYTIEDWNDLEYLSTRLGSQETPLNGHYKLVADIEGPDFSENASGFFPIGTKSFPFQGTFDGNGFTISNLVINRIRQENIGLFGVTKNATLTNVKLKKVTIRGNKNVGGLIGNIQDNTSVFNSSVSIGEQGTIIGGENSGGLIGLIEGSATIENSSVDGVVSGILSTGGLIGKMSNATSTIERSYFAGGVTSKDLDLYLFTNWKLASAESTGGLIGYVDSTTLRISNSSISSNSAVTGESAVGGFIGSINGSDVIISGSPLSDDVITDGDQLNRMIGESSVGVTII